jgi:hypothetical protein
MESAIVGLSILSSLIFFILMFGMVSLFIPNLYYNTERFLMSKKIVNLFLLVIAILDIVTIYLLNSVRKLSLSGDSLLDKVFITSVIIIFGIGVTYSAEKVHPEGYKKCKYFVCTFILLVVLKAIEFIFLL